METKYKEIRCGSRLSHSDVFSSIRAKWLCSQLINGKLERTSLSKLQSKQQLSFTYEHVRVWKRIYSQTLSQEQHLDTHYLSVVAAPGPLQKSSSLWNERVRFKDPIFSYRKHPIKKKKKEKHFDSCFCKKGSIGSIHAGQTGCASVLAAVTFYSTSWWN